MRPGAFILLMAYALTAGVGGANSADAPGSDAAAMFTEGPNLIINAPTGAAGDVVLNGHSLNKLFAKVEALEARLANVERNQVTDTATIVALEADRKDYKARLAIVERDLASTTTTTVAATTTTTPTTTTTATTATAPPPPLSAIMTDAQMVSVENWLAQDFGGLNLPLPMDSSLQKWAKCYSLKEATARGDYKGITAKLKEKIAEGFHRGCDNKGLTVTVAKTDKEHVFGGVADLSWQTATTSQVFGNSNKAFLFCLNCYGRGDGVGGPCFFLLFFLSVWISVFGWLGADRRCARRASPGRHTGELMCLVCRRWCPF